jgi:FkbM family methyltransferase
MISYLNSRLTRFFYYRNTFIYRVLRFISRRLIVYGYRLQTKMKWVFGEEATCDSMGVALSVSLKDLKGFSLWIEGSAQFEKIDYLVHAIQSYSHSGPIGFIDCGANYGEFLGVLTEDVKIQYWLAIEPNPLVNCQLEKTLSTLSAQEVSSPTTFDLKKLAIVPADGAASLQLHFNPYYSGGGSLVESFSTGNSESISVETLSVSNAIKLVAEKVQAKLITIKIDVEGFEFELLPGFITELKTRNLDFLILFETHIKDLSALGQLQSILKTVKSHKIVYPRKLAGTDLLSSEAPFTQYDIALASWDLPKVF